MKSIVRFLLSCVFALAPASATTISVLGSLDGDCSYGCQGNISPGDYAQYAAAVYSFTLPSQTAAYAITFSYGGGVNGNGAPIANGGFEPYLSLFDSAGNFLGSTYFGETCPAGSTDYQGHCYDVKLDMGTLAAGTYQLAISAYANMSYAENNGTGNLSDGFTGLGNLFPGEDLHFAFDIVTRADGGPGGEVPEPASWLLAASGLALIWSTAGRATRKEFSGVLRSGNRAAHTMKEKRK